MCWFYFNCKIYVVLHGLVNKKLLTAYFMWLINKKINNNKINKLHYSMVSPQQLPPYNGRGLIGFQFGFIDNMLYMYMHHIWQFNSSSFKAIQLSPSSQHKLHSRKKNPHKCTSK